ncbi:glycoside hydrolase family 12 protein [Jaapia argillacea MUCL 33604]|uniref:Glycoside hydrolase family 12 protein n=1 Tax=Jaapia argillacea MUCL 33604 TaxID=933084 RepID=A0A067PNC2_9AGAM|nr:glycoside hydrolase family 12 protein [Jaapia argillacea MUCL 33604]
MMTSTSHSMYLLCIVLGSLHLVVSGSTIGISTRATPQRTTCGIYELCVNGTVTATCIASSGSDVSWSATYTWASNIAQMVEVSLSRAVSSTQLSAISSAPSTYDWTYSTQSSGLRADVSYDIWLGTNSTGEPASASSSYEVMIWLSGLGGLQPVGSLVTSSISLAGYTWDLWKGPSSSTWEVFSFIPHTAGTSITSYNADLNVFFTYLIANEGVASSQYVQSVGGGTHAMTGTAELTVSAFSLVLN